MPESVWFLRFHAEFIIRDSFGSCLIAQGLRLERVLESSGKIVILDLLIHGRDRAGKLPAPLGCEVLK